MEDDATVVIDWLISRGGQASRIESILAGKWVEVKQHVHHGDCRGVGRKEGRLPEPLLWPRMLRVYVVLLVVRILENGEPAHHTARH